MRAEWRRAEELGVMNSILDLSRVFIHDRTATRHAPKSYCCRSSVFGSTVRTGGLLRGLLENFDEYQRTAGTSAQAKLRRTSAEFRLETDAKSPLQNAIKRRTS